jgi:hypothetical protein
MKKRKARKMKAEILWALVYFDGKVRGITQPELFTTRAIARSENAKVTERNGRSLCRVARVKITEIAS